MIRHLLNWARWEMASPRERATEDFLPQLNSDDSRNLSSLYASGSASAGLGESSRKAA